MSTLETSFLEQFCLELLARGHCVRSKIRGNSMAPTIYNGDRVLVRRAAVEQIDKGDIICVLAHHRIAAHRCVSAVFEDGVWRVVTKGDACSHLDEEVRGEQVVGRVIQVYRRQPVSS